MRKARNRSGFGISRLADNWLPRPEPSLQEKEIVKLKGQLKEFEKTEPQFDTKFEIQPTIVEVRQVQKLTEDEMSMQVRNIVAANPKPVQKRDLLNSMLYDSSLDDRYTKYERETVPDFVRDYHKKLELLFGQIPFTLSVENTGKVRADHANIEVQVVGGWFNTKPILTGLTPSAPKAKHPFTAPTFHRLPSMQRVVGRHEIEINKPRRSELFSAQCDDFRQGQKWEFSGVVWLDPHQEREVVIIVKLTSSPA